MKTIKRRMVGKIDVPRFIRCLAIYRRLQRTSLHIDQLARDYNVSVRSIQRDLNALADAGYGIMPTNNKGWYNLGRNKGNLPEMRTSTGRLICEY